MNDPVPPSPPAHVQTVTRPADVRDLVAHLLDPARDRPVCVISVPGRDQPALVDVDAVRRCAGVSADVYLIATGSLTQRLSDALTNDTGVYGGATRVYPPGTSWRKNRSHAPLMLARTPQETASLTSRTLTALSRALDAATAPAPRTSPQTASTPPKPPSQPLEAARVNAVVDIPDTAAALAEHVMSAQRTKPVIVISVASDAAAPFVDVDRVTAETEGIAEVYTLRTGTASWAFAEPLPPMAEVYGGASRVYPPGADWLNDIRGRSPLRFCFDSSAAPDVEQGLISDAMRYARLTSASGDHAGDPAASGRITGVVAGRGLVRLESKALGSATIVPEMIADQVPAERMFVRDQQVSGTLDTVHQRLDVTDTIIDMNTATATYVEGTTVLGALRQVESSTCTVELFPGLQVTVAADDATPAPPETDLRTILSDGEVLLARILRRGTSIDDWRLSLRVPPDAEPLQAPAILPGGPPWLLPPAGVDIAEPALDVAPPPRLIIPDADTPASVPSPPAVETRYELQQLRRDLDQARRRVTAQDTQIRQLRTARRNAETKAAEARAAVDKLQEQLGIANDGAFLFTDREEQLRFDVYVAWAHRIPAASKPDLPMASWTIGPDFFDSWDRTQGIERAKVIDVIVEVLTRQAFTSNGREAHQLRTGSGGDNPSRSREDGATAWRISLQVKTPSARRLHVWWLNDGSFELASIRLHDNFRT